MKDKGNFTLPWRKQLHFYTVVSKYLHFVYISEGKLKIINKVSQERIIEERVSLSKQRAKPSGDEPRRASNQAAFEVSVALNRKCRGQMTLTVSRDL
jgi:hypothetical protein